MVRLPLRCTRVSPRLWLVLAGGLVALLVLLWPTPATAFTCSDILPFTNVQACLDGIQYDAWRALTSALWTLPRMLLAATYYVNQVRETLTTTVFATVFQAVGGAIRAVLVGILTLALIGWGLMHLALPIFGRNFFNLKHILTWGLLTPLIILYLGPVFAWVDQVRVDLGAVFFSSAFQQTSTVSFFGPGGNTMDTPTALYPDNACGTPLTRSTVLSTPTALYLDDLTAAMLYADAQDIHCPERNLTLSPPRPDNLPRGFYDTPPAFAYADLANPDQIDQIGEIDDATARGAALDRIYAGLTQMGMSIIPAGLALIDALTQLLLSLSLMLLWFAVPIVGIFIVFARDEGPILVLVQRSGKILQVTFMIAIVSGVLGAILTQAALAGNAMAFCGMALIGGFLALYMLLTACAVLWDSLLALRESIQVGTGTSLTAPIEVAGAAAVLTGAGAVGGLALGSKALAGSAMTGMTAAGSSGSAATGVGAAMGRITPLMKVGEVATAMGGVRGSEREQFLTGLSAGNLAQRRGIGAMHRDLRRDRGRSRDERDGFAGELEQARQRGQAVPARAAQTDYPTSGTSLPAGALTPATPAGVIAATGVTERLSEQVTAQVHMNWEHLRQTMPLDAPAVTGPTVALGDALHDRVVLDAPGSAPPPTAPDADLRDVTEHHLREQTGAVTHGMTEMTAALRDGMRDVTEAARAMGHGDASADDAHDLAWDLEANRDRDTLRQTLEQEGQRGSSDTVRLTGSMQELSGSVREQTAQEALRAAAQTGATAGAAAAAGSAGSAGSGDGGMPAHQSGSAGSTGSGDAGAGIARSLESNRPAATGGDPSRDPAPEPAAPAPQAQPPQAAQPQAQPPQAAQPQAPQPQQAQQAQQAQAQAQPQAPQPQAPAQQAQQAQAQAQQAAPAQAQQAAQPQAPQPQQAQQAQQAAPAQAQAQPQQAQAQQAAPAQAQQAAPAQARPGAPPPPPRRQADPTLDPPPAPNRSAPEPKTKETKETKR